MIAIIIKWPDVFSSIFWQGLISTVGCGRTVGCLRSESGCDGTNCDYAATYIYQPSTKVVTIVMFGKDAAWVAIGFSDNQAMVWINPPLFKRPIWPIFICQNNRKSDKYFCKYCSNTYTRDQFAGWKRDNFLFILPASDPRGVLLQFEWQCYLRKFKLTV